MQAGGYATFTSEIGGARSARLQRVSDSGRVSTLWDSTKLVDGDVFVVSLVLAGRYEVRNTVDDAHASVRVVYPKLSRTPYQPAAPATISCTAGNFDPDELQVGPMQGLVISIAAPARIVINLVEPEEAPDPMAQVDTGPPRGPQGKGRLRLGTYRRPD